MSDPTRRSMREYLGIGALVTLPVLCCAAPALLAAGALGALGSWLVNPWLIGTAVLGPHLIRHPTSDLPDPTATSGALT